MSNKAWGQFFFLFLFAMSFSSAHSSVSQGDTHLQSSHFERYSEKKKFNDSKDMRKGYFKPLVEVLFNVKKSPSLSCKLKRYKDAHWSFITRGKSLIISVKADNWSFSGEVPFNNIKRNNKLFFIEGKDFWIKGVVVNKKLLGGVYLFLESGEVCLAANIKA